MKVCNKCEEKRELTEFGNYKRAKDRLNNECKKCVAVRDLESSRTKIGKLKRVYDDQVKSCKKRNHEPPTYTKKEFIKEYVNNKHYLLLYNEWVKSGYKKDYSPSFDRLDDYESYSFSNLNRWMTWKENNLKGAKDTKEGVLTKILKPIISTSIETGENIEFYSTMEAGRNGFDPSTIVKCCKGKRNHHKGYIWKYKN